MKDELEEIRHLADQGLQEVKQKEGGQKQLAKIKGKANDMKKDVDNVYSERNRLTINMLSLLNSVNVQVCYKEDEDLDEPWNVWYIPEQEHYLFGHIGQMGWHIHEEERNPKHVPWITNEREEYDGHTTQEKLQRLEELVTDVVNEIYKDSVGYEDIEKVYQAVEDLWSQDEDNSRAFAGNISKATGLKRDDARKALHKLKQENRIEVHETVGRTKFYKVKE